jgi:hypothetical protein
MQLVRDSLRVPEDWVATADKVVGYQIWGPYCNFGATRCPSTTLAWDTPELVDSVEVLEGLLPEATWEIENPNCRAGPQARGVTIRCLISTRQHGFVVSAMVYGDKWDPEVPSEPGGRHVTVGIEADE